MEISLSFHLRAIGHAPRAASQLAGSQVPVEKRRASRPNPAEPPAGTPSIHRPFPIPMRLPKRLTTPSSLLALGAGVLAVPLLMVAVLPRLGTAGVAAASLPDPATDSAVAVAPAAGPRRCWRGAVSGAWRRCSSTSRASPKW